MRINDYKCYDVLEFLEGKFDVDFYKYELCCGRIIDYRPATEYNTRYYAYYYKDKKEKIVSKYYSKEQATVRWIIGLMLKELGMKRKELEKMCTEEGVI